MSKCDFNKVLKQLYWSHSSARVFSSEFTAYFQNHTLAWVISCKFAAYCQNKFLYEHLWRAASVALH